MRELRVVIELSTTASCGVMIGMMMMMWRRLCTEEQTPQKKNTKKKRKAKLKSCRSHKDTEEAANADVPCCKEVVVVVVVVVHDHKICAIWFYKCFMSRSYIQLYMICRIILRASGQLDTIHELLQPQE